MHTAVTNNSSQSMSEVIRTGSVLVAVNDLSFGFFHQQACAGSDDDDVCLKLSLQQLKGEQIRGDERSYGGRKKSDAEASPFRLLHFHRLAEQRQRWTLRDLWFARQLRHSSAGTLCSHLVAAVQLVLYS